MKLWHGILLMLLILTLPLTGCGGSYEDDDLRNYLTQVTPLIEELSDITDDLFDIAEGAGPFGVAEPENIIANYKERYEDLLLRFGTRDYPNDAVKLREYTIGIINLRIQMMDAILEYADTRDKSHWDRAESYEVDTEELWLLAADEWDRLTDIAGEGEEDGISILQIFLGLLFFGVAATIAMFVLSLTLGAGYGIIGGITIAIGAIVKKIKGG